MKLTNVELDAKMRKWMKNKRRYDGQELKVGDVVIRVGLDNKLTTNHIDVVSLECFKGERDIDIKLKAHKYKLKDPIDRKLQLIIKPRDIPELMRM